MVLRIACLGIFPQMFSREVLMQQLELARHKRACPATIRAPGLSLLPGFRVGSHATRRPNQHTAFQGKASSAAVKSCPRNQTYHNWLVPKGAGCCCFWPWSTQCLDVVEHSEQVAVKLHRAALAAAGAAGLHHDPFDQRSNRLASCCTFRRSEVSVERGHGAAVDRLIIAGQPDHLHFQRRRTRPLEGCLLLLKFLEPAGKRTGCIRIFLYPGDQLGHARAHLDQLHIDARSVGVDVARRFLKFLLQGGGEAADEFRAEQPVADACQGALL